MRSRVFCFGDAALDNIVPIEALPSPEYAAMFYTESFHIGGTICNTAVDLASWGVPTTLATAYDLGLDEYGDRLIDLLQAFPALDLSRVVRRQDTHTPYCRLLVTPDGERSMLGFRPRREPDHHLSPEMVSEEQIVVANASVDVRHLDAFHALRVRGLLTVSGDIINPAHPDLPAVAVAINSAGDIRERYPDRDVRGLSRQLHEISGGVVITTDRGDPIHVIDADGSEFLVRPAQARPVDATGAGDAFRAGVVYGMLQGWPLSQTVRWASAAGTLVVQQYGATVTATVEQVSALAEYVTLLT